ncbi:MAG TPA: kelch repeat-containing protein [Candidatus Sulfotelmatobacter sp.]|jgi:hypothetical protein|nr:kelch repeat-containing protein [Candidatus Sulfotelmatobacter sp.]
MKPHMFILLFLVTVLTASSRIEGQVSWTAHSPAIRCCMGMSANVSGNSPVSGTLLFGGFDGTSYFADSWIFREGRWIQIIPASSPAARQGPGMAYDAATDTVVLFGGTAADGTDLGDTWIWNGETWTQVLPSVAPSGRRLDTQGMAYDAATQTVLLFGGYSNATGQVFGDTWSWNGQAKTWTQQHPTASPSARRAPIAYDAIRGKVVLFGGDDPSSGNAFGDTWTWDGRNWAQRTPAASPSQRGLASMAFDASVHKVVLFGGVTPGQYCPNNDTWAWNGTNWTLVSPSAGPPSRFAAGMASDPAAQSAILFGGFGCGFGLSDTWVLALSE